MPRAKPAKPKSTKAKSSRDKVRAHRARMRKQGLKLVQMWVPDERVPGFAEEARRQGLAVARSPHAKEDQDWVDAAQISLDDLD